MNKQVIIGTLLGDAYIQKSKQRKSSYSFDFQQSREDYAIWKAKKIDLNFSSKTYERYDKRTKKKYKITNIHLTMDKIKKEYFYNLFYKDKKHVSLEVLNMLKPLGICIWFLDDGNMYYNGNNCHITIAINGFSIEERSMIIDWFKKKYELNFKHTQKAIRLTSRFECEKFMNIVKKYIPKCMKYKKLSEAIKKHNNSLTNEQKSYRNKKYRA